jgi:hypothetical protein
MRNLNNAVTDMMVELGMGDAVRDTITNDPNNQRMWTIRFESHPNALIHSLLVIEVIEEDDGDASVCVMQKVNVGFRALNRIMDRLVSNLDDMPILIPVLRPAAPLGGQPSQQQ